MLKWLKKLFFKGKKQEQPVVQKPKKTYPDFEYYEIAAKVYHWQQEQHKKIKEAVHTQNRMTYAEWVEQNRLQSRIFSRVS